MKYTVPFALFLGAAALMLVGLSAQAADPKPDAPPMPMMQERGFDWVGHTQKTLDELMPKLNLAPGQMGAWQTWSSGVLNDARRHAEQRRAMEQQEGAPPPPDLSTPEQMQRGIERLRTRLGWMQQHLTQLEAAQARTRTFYDALDANQKTIFDLYWHEMFHRMAGHDGGGMGMGMGMRREMGNGPMEQESGPR